METFTHIDEYGNARMVDVSEKDVTSRRAEAEGYIGMSGECFSLLQAGKHKKGDVLTVAQVAGIMGTKQTAGLIPLCHSLELTGCKLLFYPGERPGEGKKDCYVRAVCQVECTGKTGAEMEALTGVTTALLTVYDMCKAVDRSMEITGISLLRKSGGKSGDYVRKEG